MPQDLAKQFEALWESSDSPPDLFAFLEQHNGLDAADKLAVLLQDQQHRWKTDQPLKVEEYLARLPELASDQDCKLQLAVGEFQARQNGDTSPGIDEFTSRFSDISEELRNKLSKLASGTASGDAANTGGQQSVGDPALEATLTFQSQLTVNDERIGRYRLLRILGEGAFGRVWLGQDEELQRYVAIKVPTPDRFRSSEDAETYLSEARTLASLDHPHIVPVHDVGRADDGSVYIVSKFIEGGDLAQCIKEARPAHAEAVALIATVAAALQHAHDKRLIHRDIKPANILIEESTQHPYVADFGLAIREEHFGKEHVSAGTPAYMSPEQARGEGHRLDGRSDIFSLGVVFYELLTGKQPFRGSTHNELLHQVVSVDPPLPRELDDSIPAELERICLKALSKRASDRYSAATEMADDLLHWKQGPEQDNKELQIVPKGLRSFDADDADFFLDLLPGPRNRDGLPESIQFWKTRIEETDADKTFSVGLIYGPSGCGKSSLMKAGLLPRLSEEVNAVYVEATPDETETRILRGLRKLLPNLPDDLGLIETFTLLRRGAGKKVVVVFDQFEQWLHAHRAEQETELVNALRQCDGETLQAVVMVRDDFAMAAARFMRELETRIVEGHNFNTIDLFDVGHAQKVLIKFGQAFGKLPAQSSKLTNEEQSFVDAVVLGLAQDGKVVSVRLALFAEMVKGKPWIPATLDEVGGTEGIGVNFLEETFSRRDANPEHRLHQQSAREVLKALLPEVGTDIKGHMRSHEELLEASGYQNRTSDFNDLLRILDGELRLITPTDPEGFQTKSGSDPGSKYYQLTHDYLVPSLRKWLTRKQLKSRKGRAELKLEERSAPWTAKPENRHLPSLWEWASVRTLTERKKWTEPQRKMMGKAVRVHGFRSGIVITLLVVATVSGIAIRNRILEDRAIAATENVEKQNANYGKALVESLSAANTADIEDLVDEIGKYQEWTTPLLQEIVANDDSDPIQKLHASLVLVKDDPSHVNFLFQRLLSAKADDVPVIVRFLKTHRGQLDERLWDTIENGSNSERIRAAAAQSEYDSSSEQWKKVGEDIVTALVSVPSSESDEWIEMLRPVGSDLAAPLEKRFRDRSAERDAERPLVALALADYLKNEPKKLTELMLLADIDREFQPLLLAIRNHRKAVVPELQSLISQSPLEHVTPEKRDTFWKKLANAAVCLLELGETESVWPLFQQTPNPSLRSFIIDRLALLGANHEFLAARIKQESDPASRYALILALGQFDFASMSSQQRQSLEEQLAILYRDDPEPGVHSAAGWALRNWQQDRVATDAELRNSPPKQNHNWFVNSQGQTFAVVNGPVEFLMGEKTRRTEPRKVTLSHRFAVATHEVTVAQFQNFHSDHKHNSLHAPKPDCPVNEVSWYDAVAYCNWLSEQEGIPKDQWCYEPNDKGEYSEGMKIPANYLERTGYRLPTDEEWEFVCRAGTTRSYGFGEPMELLTSYSWYLSNAESHMWPVGLKMPNALGVFDMHGNADEWCHNLNFFAVQSRSAGVAVKDLEPRLLRGGSFDVHPSYVRSAYRGSYQPSLRSVDVGFRPSRTYNLFP